MVRGNQRSYNRRRGICGTLSGPTGTDQASALSGSLYDCSRRGFKAPGAFNSVGVDQLHAGFKVWSMNPVSTFMPPLNRVFDVHVTTELGCLNPVFLVLGSGSSGDIHFSGFWA